MPYIEIGSILYCTGEFSHPVGFYTRDIQAQEPYRHGDIDFIYGPVPATGTQPVCHICHSRIYHEGPSAPWWSLEVS